MKRIRPAILVRFVGLSVLSSLACTSSPGDIGQLSATGDDSTGSESSGGQESGDGSASSSEDGDGDIGPKLDVIVPDMMQEEEPLSCDQIDESDPTSVGCEFWTIPTPIFFGPVTNYGVSLGNPSDEIATVTFEDMRGANDTLREITTVEVDPKASVAIKMNGGGGLLENTFPSPPQGVAPLHAVRMTSDVPITVMQISPMGGASSVMPDASLLLPTNALGNSHIGIGYPGLGNWVVAIATQDGTTISTVQGDVQIDAFDTVHYSVMGDATGFFLGSDAPISVFSGTLGSQVPVGLDYADHLEEQVLPLSAWGKTYVAARHPIRPLGSNPNGAEDVHWRVLAGVPNTTVNFEPPQPGVGGQIVLAEVGDFVEIVSEESFVATGSENFLLVQYMGSCELTDPDGDPNDEGICGTDFYYSDTHDPLMGTGDPYMVQMVPVEQWLEETPFLTDDTYRHDFVTVARTMGDEVTVDCVGVLEDDRFFPIPGTDFEVAQVFLDLDGSGGEGDCVDGQQYISAEGPIGLFVGGYDYAASYAYPGGLSIKTLWDPPDEPPG